MGYGQWRGTGNEGGLQLGVRERARASARRVNAKQSLATLAAAIAWVNIGIATSLSPAAAILPIGQRPVPSDASDANVSATAQSHYEAGLTHAHRGNYSRAITEFDEAIRLAPNFSQAFQDRGSSHLALSNAVAAMADYNRAIRLTPEDSNAYYNRGNAHLQQQRYLQAIADYDRAIALNESDAAAWKNRALAHATTGDLERAVSGLQQSARLHQLQDDEEGYKQVLEILEYLQPDLDPESLTGVESDSPTETSP